VKADFALAQGRLRQEASKELCAKIDASPAHAWNVSRIGTLP
jgi:hypothetical protein